MASYKRRTIQAKAMWPTHPLSMTVLSGKMCKSYAALVMSSVLGLAKEPARPGSPRLVAFHDPYGLCLDLCGGIPPSLGFTKPGGTMCHSRVTGAGERSGKV